MRDMRERYVDLSQVRLHVVEDGEGPLVVLLHGFPEFWYSWRHQIPAIAAAGMRVVAPDMRGYNLSDKPQGVGAYAVEHLARDVEVGGLTLHQGPQTEQERRVGDHAAGCLIGISPAERVLRPGAEKELVADVAEP